MQPRQSLKIACRTLLLSVVGTTLRFFFGYEGANSYDHDAV